MHPPIHLLMHPPMHLLMHPLMHPLMRPYIKSAHTFCVVPDSKLYLSRPMSTKAWHASRCTASGTWQVGGANGDDRPL